MLYVKLALRNLKRSLKEYSIYVFTVTITMTLLYAFFAIAFSGEMQDLVTTYDNVKSIMNYGQYSGNPDYRLADLLYIEFYSTETKP